MALLEKKNTVLGLLDSTNSQLINKLSLILSSKIDKDVNDFLVQDKATPATIATVTKTSNSIVTAFLQMVEITDEYLEVESVRQVLRAGFQAMSQKYLTHLLLRGGRHRAEV
jgi:hypothetical protein